MSKSILSTITAVLAALILLQTLWFKFTGAEESVFIFSKLGIEPMGRIGSGIAELTASILLLIPKFRAFGALLGLGIMAGAIVSHFAVLGIVVQNDGGLLFIYASTVFVCCAYIVLINKYKLLNSIKR